MIEQRPQTGAYWSPWFWYLVFRYKIPRLIISKKAERGYTLVSDTLTCQYSFLFPQVLTSNLFFFRPGMTESAESTPTPSLILNSYEKPFLEEMQMLAAKNLTTKNEIRDAVWCCLSRFGPYLYRLDYYKQRVHVGCWGRRSRNWVLGWLRFRAEMPQLRIKHRVIVK